MRSNHHQTPPLDVVLPFDRRSHAVLPHPVDYVRVEKMNGAGSDLSLRADIAHSGQTIATMINDCEEPDFFGAVGALGPAPAGGGVDDALLVRSEREFVDVSWSLLGMKAKSLIFDISHRQWADLHGSKKLQRSIARSQMLVADTIAEHVNTVLAVDDLPCYKYGWSCGADANFKQGEEGLLGPGTLSVIEQIDATPMGHLKYTRYGSGRVEDIIADHVFTKINGLLELPEFDDVDPEAEEFAIQRAREVARVRGVGAALASEHGRRNLASEHERRRIHGATAAQRDHFTDLQEAGVRGFVESRAADAAASGDQICCRAGCRRKAHLSPRTGEALTHGRCKICK